VSAGRLRRAWSVRKSRSAADRLRELADGSRPIVAGPWLGGVGIELLYWIPLLRWLTTDAGVAPDRVVAVSRAGADAWYADVAGSYVDLLDHYGTRRLSTWGRRHQHELDRPKPIERTSLDRKAFRAVTGEGELSQAEWLHPSLMFRLFRPRWFMGAGPSVVENHTDQQLLPDDPEPPLAPAEEPYVAVKAYFNPSFPDTAENRETLQRLIAQLAEQLDVVLLGPAAEDGDVVPFETSVSSRVRRAPAAGARDSLRIQSALVRHAEALVAPYGGFSYLGPYLGTPTLAFYSDASFEAAHLDAIDRVGRQLGSVAAPLYRARHVGHLEAAELSSPDLAGTPGG